MSAASVAIVVPVFDGETLLEGCIDALLRTTTGARVLVVDDGSRDASLAVARRLAARCPSRVRSLALERNGGFAAAVNRGIDCLLASTEPPASIVLVNQDCIVRAGWLEPLLAALDDPRVAIAGARLYEADGVTLQHAGASVGANGLTSHIGRGSRDERAFREPAIVDYVCAALVALRTPVWQRIGPFDEGYAPAYFEEVDWSLRARRAGLHALYVPASEALHVEAASSGRGSRLYLRRYHRSRMRLVARWIAPQQGWPAWMRAEIGWLLRLRRWREIAPVLRAWTLLPGLLRERHRGTHRRQRCGMAAISSLARADTRMRG